MINPLDEQLKLKFEARIEGIGYVYSANLLEALQQLQRGERIATTQDIAFARIKAGIYQPGTMKIPNALWCNPSGGIVYTETAITYKGYTLYSRLSSRILKRFKEGKEDKFSPKTYFAQSLDIALQDTTKRPQERRVFILGKNLEDHTYSFRARSPGNKERELALWMFGFQAKEYLALISEKTSNRFNPDGAIMTIMNPCSYNLKGEIKGYPIANFDSVSECPFFEMDFSTFYNFSTLDPFAGGFCSSNFPKRTRIISPKDYRAKQIRGVEL